MQKEQRNQSADSLILFDANANINILKLYFATKKLKYKNIFWPWEKFGCTLSCRIISLRYLYITYNNVNCIMYQLPREY